jgi:hypothetical protein
MQALASQEKLLHNDAERQQQLAGVAMSLEASRLHMQHGLAEATFEQRRKQIQKVTAQVARSRKLLTRDSAYESTYP